MVGAKQTIIDASDFVKGISTSDDVSDGGFSPDTTAVNLIVNPGVIYAPSSPTDKSTSLVGDIIASCEDPAASAARLFVSKDSTDDGRFFSSSSNGTLTLRGSEDTGQDYVSGKTDMIPYKGEVYVTGSQYIVRWQQPATFNTTFYDFTSTYGLATSVPHPAIVYENNAYYGNGNLLLMQTSAGGAPTVILTLATSQVIITLGIDNSTGLMMISTVDQFNVSGTVNSRSKVLLYDGNSQKVARVIEVGEMFTAFYNVSGITFITYGASLGYWNGSGSTYLTDLRNVTLNNDQLAYKHHITNIGRTLYVADGKQVLAYGEVLPGRKVFYYAQDNTVSSAKYTCITYIGSSDGTNRQLGLSFNDSKFYVFDTVGTATADSISFVTNKYMYPRPVFLRSVRLEYGDSGVANGGSIGDLKYLSSEEAAAAFTTLSTTVNSSGGTVYSTNNIIGFVKNKVTWIQLKLDTFTQLRRLRRIIIYWDPAE